MKSIQLPDEVYDRVAKLAEADQVSVDRVVAALVMERLSDWSRLEARASRGSLEKLGKILSKIPGVEPEAHDRL
jgi:predicted transcriptional regulator